MTTSRHLLIAGTGRAGTSLLVRLLHECGLQTVSPEQGRWHDTARAGLENNLAAPAPLPYVVKSAWAHEHLREVLEEGRIALDALILPVRNLAEAAASRIIVELEERYERSPAMATQPMRRTLGHVPGGVVFSLEPIDQQRILAIALHRVIEVALDYDVPIVLLKFPRFVTDAEYAYSRLAPVVPGLGAFDDFRRAFATTADPSSIRVETEALAEPSAFHAEPSVEEVSLAELDEAAVRRRIRTLTRDKRLLEQQVAALSAEVDPLRKGA